MEQQNKELAEDKVLILYLLNKIFDGIKNDNLYKIVSSSKDINYFYFQELIADLKRKILILLKNLLLLLNLSPKMRIIIQLRAK